MNTYMHCRPSCATNIPSCSSSFIFVRPDYTTTLNYQTYIPSFYHHHDQALPPPPPPPPRQRRRLEDPIITYASNYYASYPPQTSHSPPPQPPPLPPPRQVHQKSDRNGIYCDLFNLLERPAPSPTLVKERRKYASHDQNSCCHHCRMNFENAHSKVRSTLDRKRHRQQSSYYKENKCQDDKLPSTEKTKTMNSNNYQRRSPNKGFFRRIVRNYFCMPTTITNNGYSS